MNSKKNIVGILFSLLLLFFATFELAARESPFTKKGTGPKYWMAYEYCWVNNTAIPEDRWKSNIEWVEANFKEYGYDMICNDGWIETAQTINKNGYIIKYNDNWEHSFEYWADYLAEKEMKLGVYYNPMWMTKAAFDENVIVQGTNIRAQDIYGPISFNESLYWVDVDKEGSKEWIQGYVKYFINIGAKYLRIDFLENYEKNYGTAKYIQALKWIEEAAGDDIFLSLVMPNCFDHCRNELIYGDMIRIDDDCFDGGWEFVSDRRRGEQKAIWPQYGNAFDGFIGFADIGGRNQMILDGDFMRMNTMANDKERMFKFSLMVMGGSALAIADQYDTIEEHEWVYQNKELLELNEQGFVAKPLSFDHKDIERSSIWAGQLPNGDWIVGFFNREETKQTRRIDFDKDLGIEGGYASNVRDLWKHKNWGPIYGGYSVELDPHECQIVRIKNNSLKYEAEFASMIGGAQKQTTAFSYSGIGYVGNLEKSGSHVLFAVETPSRGDYTLRIEYSNTMSRNAIASIYINDEKNAKQLILPSLPSENKWGICEIEVSLESDFNFISIENGGSDKESFCLDYIELFK